MSSQREEVPDIPPLNYDNIPDGWNTYDTSHPRDAPVPLNEVTDTNLSETDQASNLSLSEADEASDSGFSKASVDSKVSSVVDPSEMPPVLRPAPPLVFDGDQAFENLKSRILNLTTRPPSLHSRTKSVLRALCQDFGIRYNTTDNKKILVARIMLYRQEYGLDDDYVSKIRYDKLKRTFEADEPSRSSLMKFEHEYLEKLCVEYKIPPFDSSQPGITSLTKDVMVQRILIWNSINQGKRR
ncbi:hypothetical protein GG344DRAFT_69785, partial [Lentinula edodes]